jgi:flagellar biosynthesis protein FliR
VLPIFSFKEVEILAFALVLIRVSAFLVSWPVFSVYSVPNHLKVLLALCITFLLFPTIDKTAMLASGLEQDIMFLAGKEALTGVCLGFLTRLFFFAVSIGGNLVATAIGLANAQVFNPTLGAQSTTVEQFYMTLGTLLFLALNGHHLFLTGLAQSFEAIPIVASQVSNGIGIASSMSVAGATASANGLEGLVGDVGLVLETIIESGIKISAPVMTAILMTNLVMGIVGRAVPQVNVLVTSMSVNFMAGLVVMMVSIPALIMEMDREIMMFAEQLFKLMKAF